MMIFRTATGLSSQEHIDEKAGRKVRVFLACLSGMMLGVAFPPSTLGAFACLALVPLLVVIASVRSTASVLRYTYLAMVVFHAVTLNWTGGYAHMKDPYMILAGTMTILVHPLFYFIPLGLFQYVRKQFGGLPALAALPFLWVGYEYTHSLSEWSFPWLTLGNTQSFDLPRIQMASFTGVYGLSFWIVCLNVLAFLLFLNVSAPSSHGAKRRGLIPLGVFAVLYFLPWAYGMVVLHSAATDGDHPGMDRGEVSVGIIQPNLDPWEKWTTNGPAIIDGYVRATEELMRRPTGKPPSIVLWPETAMPYFLLLPMNRWMLDEIRLPLRAWGVSVLTGTPHLVEYADTSDAPRSAKRDARTGHRYDTFNAAVFIDPRTDSLPWYGKMKMVPLAERIPYSDWFSSVDFLRWTVGMGGWQIGPGQVIFHDAATQARFSTSICYESVYPGFVAASVRRGAEFLSIITIDSWWDHMSGAFQHERYAVFRAVENRRWVARCALGGISCFIDPYGRMYDETALDSRAAIVRTIGRSAELTFYSRHGDLASLVCLCISGGFLAAAAGRAFLSRMRTLQGAGS